MIEIVIGGDIYPGGGSEPAFVEGRSDLIFGDLLPLIVGADLSVANLECPLVSQNTAIDKAGGAVLGASVECVRGLKESGWQLLNLANNHSYDHGSAGLRDTIESVKRAGVGVVGAGENVTAAEAPFITERGGKRIVVYAMAEREYSIADDQMPGANPLDVIRCVRAIRAHKRDGVFLVLIHGGLEHHLYPSPEMVQRCRFLIECGADAVICCHSHCALPWEQYLDRPIVYGLGNLIFEGWGEMPDSWYEGYLARILIDRDRVGLEVVPYTQSREDVGARLMKGREKDTFIALLEERGLKLKEERLIAGIWEEACLARRDDYLCELLGYNRFMKKLRAVLFSTVHGRKPVLTALHLAQCESHREVLNAIFTAERRSG